MLNYFDHAATSPMSAKAIESYVRAAHDFPLNPSSIHTGGILAHKALEEARKKVSSILGIREDEVIFTSGATEAISMVFSSLLWQKNPGRVLISRVEHDAVKSFIPLLKEKGWDVVTLRAKKGFVNPEDGTVLASNDIGIRNSEQKYGSCNGKQQELEGPPEAEKLLQKLGFAPEVTERVCWLIAHHHTYNGITGADYQILVEADFLVNLYEDGVGMDAVKTAYARIFKTQAGRRMCRTMYGLAE